MVDATKVSSIKIDTGYDGVKEYNIFNRGNSKYSECAIILGKNGSGKSTIARALRTETKDTEFYDTDGNSLGGNCSNVYVFDESFIIENFRIHNDKSLEPVILLGDFTEQMNRINQYRIELSANKDAVGKVILKFYDEIVEKIKRFSGPGPYDKCPQNISVLDAEIDSISVKDYILALFEYILWGKESFVSSDIDLVCKSFVDGEFNKNYFCRWAILNIWDAHIGVKGDVNYPGMREYIKNCLSKKQKYLIETIQNSSFYGQKDIPRKPTQELKDLMDIRQDFMVSLLTLIRYEWKRLFDRIDMVRLVDEELFNNTRNVVQIYRSQRRNIDIALKRAVQKLERDTKKQSSQNVIRYINNLLGLVFGNEALTIEADGYIGYRVRNRGDLVPQSKLSVGEQNILSLCYFFAKISEERSLEDSMSRNQMIILDDPVSSFDDDNKYGVTVLLAYLCQSILKKNSKTQLIILTHDSSFALTMKKMINEIESGRLSCWEIQRGSKDPLKKSNFSVDEYFRNLNLMYEYIFNKNGDAPAPNEVRRVWEAFLCFELGETSIANINKLKNMIVCFGLDDRVEKFIDVFIPQLFINTDSHAANQVKGGNFYLKPALSGRQYKRFVVQLVCFMHIVSPHHIAWRLSDNSDKAMERKEKLDGLLEDVLSHSG